MYMLTICTINGHQLLFFPVPLGALQEGICRLPAAHTVSHWQIDNMKVHHFRRDEASILLYHINSSCFFTTMAYFTKRCLHRKTIRQRFYWYSLTGMWSPINGLGKTSLWHILRSMVSPGYLWINITRNCRLFYIYRQEVWLPCDIVKWWCTRLHVMGVASSI